MLRIALKVVGIELCDLSLLFGVVLVEVKSFFIQNVSNNVGADLIVGTKGEQVFQSLGESRKMVVNFELASKLGEGLQLPEEGEVFSGILEKCQKMINYWAL